MKEKDFVWHLRVAALGVFFLFCLCSNIEAFDFSAWDRLIKIYVSPGTLEKVAINAVDYGGLKADPAFSRLVSRLESFPLESLGSRYSRLAFWINVYNILAAKMITDHYPVEGIKEVGSFFRPVWKLPAGNIGGRERTLNDIENNILRKMNEPRIHVAIVCASISCPDLRLEAYEEEKLNTQLDDQMKGFLRSREKGMRLEDEKNRVYLSSIFKWFAEDFESRGGVLKYIGKFLTKEERKKLNSSPIIISYLDYNWKLNGR